MKKFLVIWTENVMDGYTRHLYMTKGQLDEAKRMYVIADASGDLKDWKLLDGYMSDMEERDVDVYICTDDVDDSSIFAPCVDELLYLDD